MKIVIAGLETENEDLHFDETKSLAPAALHEIVGELVQKRRTPHPATFFGEGKVYELKELIEKTNAEGCMIANAITPSQMRTLKEMLNVFVFDRNDCILQIFGVRAKTKQAKLQVELAKLKHELPFVIHTQQNFSRMGGGRNKGEGEKQYQLDRRKYELRIQRVERELKAIKTSSATRKKKRSSSDMKLIALVGYTNAGKSTLMNGMLKLSQAGNEKEVFVKDMLFATLDTSVRRISIKGIEFLLSDTVGFISHLPHELLEAFHSTLQEVSDADLILQVIDENDAERFEHIQTTDDTLKQLKAEDTPMWMIHNKCDKCGFKTNEKGHFYVSAETGEGMEALMEAIEQEIRKEKERLTLHVQADNQELISLIYKYGRIIEVHEEEDDIIILAEIDRKRLDIFREYVKK